MVKISKESELIKVISNLINNPNISTQEFEILSSAKNKLEQKKYTPKVISELKSDLVLLLGYFFSKESVSFYTKLSH